MLVALLNPTRQLQAFYPNMKSKEQVPIFCTWVGNFQENFQTQFDVKKTKIYAYIYKHFNIVSPEYVSNILFKTHKIKILLLHFLSLNSIPFLNCHCH